MSRSIAAGKVLNQATMLRYFAKNRRETAPMPLSWRGRRRCFCKRTPVASKRCRRHGRRGPSGRVDVEAQAARRYWAAARELLLPELGWERRETRGATDVVNVCLNYGYGILLRRGRARLPAGGARSVRGFLHVDRAGKPSLSLDLIEEFRQAIVDRTIFGLLNRGVHPEIEAGRLGEADRRQLAEKVLERLDGREPHEGKQHTLRTIVQMQARSLAAFLRRDRATYVPFRARW